MNESGATGISQVCVNPENNHIIVMYNNGNIQDSGVCASNPTQFNICPSGPSGRYINLL